jgi:hypothetical protein
MVRKTIPAEILLNRDLDLPEAVDERRMLEVEEEFFNLRKNFETNRVLGTARHSRQESSVHFVYRHGVL